MDRLALMIAMALATAVAAAPRLVLNTQSTNVVNSIILSSTFASEL